MMAMNPGKVALQARIALIRVGAVPGAISILFLVAAAVWIWFSVNARMQGQQEYVWAQARQTPSTPSSDRVAAPQPGAEQNLQKFYGALGDRSETERYLKVLFAAAAQTGLDLDQGEYQWKFDSNSNTYRYHILLPVKGSYGVIRQFCKKILLALPFASLDELSFKRESVGEDTLDASLRFTFYLKNSIRAPAGMAK